MTGSQHARVRRHGMVLVGWVCCVVACLVPLSSAAVTVSLACLQVSVGGQDFDGRQADDIYASRALCGDRCAVLGREYFSLRDGNRCYCPSTLAGQTNVSNTTCSMPCLQDPLDTCGGPHSHNLHAIILVPTVSPPVPVPETLVPVTPSPTPVPTQALPTGAPPTLVPATPVSVTAAPPASAALTQVPPTPVPATAAPPTSVPETQVPPTLVPTLVPTGVPATHVPFTPAQSTPAPPTPAPLTPAPSTVAPPTPSPLTPAPLTPAPDTPAPPTVAPLTLAPPTMVPPTPAPATAAPPTPAPLTPAPPTKAPPTPAPDTPAPPTPAPLTTAPPTPAPDTPAPPTPAPLTPAPPTTAPPTPAPATPAPPTPVPLTPAPPTPAPPTKAPATLAPSTSAPETPAPLTSAPLTTAPATQAPATVAPSTPSPATPAPVRQVPTPLPTQPSTAAPALYQVQDIGDDVFVSADSASSSVLAGAAASVSAGSAMQLALAASGCTGKIPRALNPTGLVIDGSEALGALVANAVITVSFGLLCFMLLKVAMLGGARVAPKFFEGLDTQGFLRLPSAPLFIFHFFFQGITLAGMTLAFYGKTWHVATGICVLAGCMAVPFYLLRVFTNIDTRAVYARATGRTSCSLVALIGPGEWVNISHGTLFVQRYGSVLKTWRQDCAWFVAVDFVSSFMLSAIASLVPESDAGCGHVKLATGVIFLMRAILTACLKPHARWRDNALHFAMLLLQTAAMTLLSLGYYSHSTDSPLFGIATVLLQCSGALLVVKLVLDVAAEAHILYTGRRDNLQADVLPKLAPPSPKPCEALQLDLTTTYDYASEPRSSPRWSPRAGVRDSCSMAPSSLPQRWRSGGGMEESFCMLDEMAPGPCPMLPRNASGTMLPPQRLRSFASRQRDSRDQLTMLLQDTPSGSSMSLLPSLSTQSSRTVNFATVIA